MFLLREKFEPVICSKTCHRIATLSNLTTELLSLSLAIHFYTTSSIQQRADPENYVVVNCGHKAFNIHLFIVLD